MSEEIFTKLRYCFQGGYTLPQFCVEKGIRKPLFVLERDSKCFLLEVHAQFRYDKRIPSHTFCFIDGDIKLSNIHLVQRILGTNISVKHISQMSIEYFDVVIFLTQKKYDLNTRADRIITFSQLETFFVQRTYVDIPILHFLQRFPKVKFFLTNFPNDINRYEGGKDFFKKELLSRDQLGSSLTNKGNHEIPFDRLGRYADAEIRQLIKFCKAKENPDGTTLLLEDKHPLINIQNGKRITAYQPEHYQNKIYFFGPCHHVGQYAPFDKTIESYLQQMLNENKLPYRVENFGQCFSERTQDMFYNLNALNPSPGDIFFCCIISAGMHSNDDVIPFCDISDAFDPPHDYKEVFCVQYHVNELGYKLVAEKYFKFLTENNFFRDKELKYPPPVKFIFIDMVYLHNLNKAA